MTKRKRDGKVTEEGLFLFYGTNDVPVFSDDTPLERKVETLHYDFTPRKILDINEFFRRYVRNWVNGKDLDLSLWLDYRNNPRLDYAVFELPYAFRLVTHSGWTRPIAMISFDFQDDGSVFTKQNQGVRGEKDILKFIEWDRMFYQLLWSWASQYNFPRVKVQRAEHNIFYKEPTLYEGEGKNHYIERLMRRYTLLPIELGFEKSPDGMTLVKVSDPSIKAGKKKFIRAVE